MLTQGPPSCESQALRAVRTRSCFLGVGLGSPGSPNVCLGYLSLVTAAETRVRSSENLPGLTVACRSSCGESLEGKSLELLAGASRAELRGSAASGSRLSCVPPGSGTPGTAVRQVCRAVQTAAAGTPCRRAERFALQTLAPLAHGPDVGRSHSSPLSVAGPQFAEDPSQTPSTQLPASPFGDYRQYQ